MTECYLGLGSNLGDRRKNINLAVRKINTLKQTKVIGQSRIIETEPVGGPPGQPKFLNAALKIRTGLTPPLLLKGLQRIESELGRPKRHIRNSPRTIDLDILFYGDRIVDRRELKIPHPRIFERDFVVRSLLEVI